MTDEVRNADFQAERARRTSYVPAAIVAFLLYMLLWLPGLVVNIIWLREARRTERVAGTTLPGVGCLRWMFMSQVMSVVLLVVLAVLLVVALS